MITLKNCSPLNILLAVDGSEHARAAAQLLRDLLLPPGSEVTAVGVLTPRYAPGQVALSAALNEAQAILKDNGVKVMTGLLHSHPAEALTEYADVQKPDLIVVGAQGLRATPGILLGSVTQQVVEYARWPVLVVRAPYQGLRRVLLVTDGSPHSQLAMKYLARFPLRSWAEVRVMHVLPPISPPEFLVSTSRALYFGAEIPALSAYEVEEAVIRQVEAEEHAGYTILAEAIDALKSCGIEAASVLVRGDAATKIIEYVTEQAIDLVVAGSRGLSQVQGWLLGSVSDKLVYYAGCSVLVVEGQAAAEEG